jgi:hypothetical protein
MNLLLVALSIECWYTHFPHPYSSSPLAMKGLQVTSVLAFAAKALAHGYIYRVTSDNTV